MAGRLNLEAGRLEVVVSELGPWHTRHTLGASGLLKGRMKDLIKSVYVAKGPRAGSRPLLHLLPPFIRKSNFSEYPRALRRALEKLWSRGADPEDHVRTSAAPATALTAPFTARTKRGLVASLFVDQLPLTFPPDASRSFSNISFPARAEREAAR